MSSGTFSGDMLFAIATCQNQVPSSRVCKLSDYHQACGDYNNNPSAADPFENAQDSFGWVGDKGTTSGGNWDDEYGTRNRDYCTLNLDGPALSYGNFMEFHCCY